jgi:hypothetical protein
MAAIRSPAPNRNPSSTKAIRTTNCQTIVNQGLRAEPKKATSRQTAAAAGKMITTEKYKPSNPPANMLIMESTSICLLARTQNKYHPNTHKPSRQEPPHVWFGQLFILS